MQQQRTPLITKIPTTVHASSGVSIHICVNVPCTDSFCWCHMRTLNRTPFCGRGVTRWSGFICNVRVVHGPATASVLSWCRHVGMLVGLNYRRSIAHTNLLGLSMLTRRRKRGHSYSFRIRIRIRWVDKWSLPEMCQIFDTRPNGDSRTCTEYSSLCE